MTLTTAQQIQAPARAFLESECPYRQRALESFRKADDFLRHFSVSEFLHHLLGPKASAVLEQTYGYVHVGLLTPPGLTKTLFEELVTEVGFDDHLAIFGSEVMALELAELSGGAPVPTTIYKAFGGRGEDGARGIELFAPTASESTVLHWIDLGVGNHVGIGLQSREAVVQAMDLCRPAGFAPPPFLKGQPAVNSAEEILVVYTDGSLDGVPLRLEFYHSRSELARCSPNRTAVG
jgi:hypothetical protein